MPRTQQEPEHIDFKPNDRAAVLARMDGMAREGKGWINLSPAIDEDQELPERSSTFGIFSGRGPDVPLCTWVPAKGKTPAQLGIQHGAGTKASLVLNDLAHPIPEGWRATQDHPRRGLVLLLPPGTTNEVALDWLIGAGTALASHLRLAGWWRAGLYPS